VPAKFDRCVREVRQKGTARDPYAICGAALSRSPNPSQAEAIEAAAEKFRAFTGEAGDILERVQIPERKVFLVVGELVALAYGAVRNGVYDEWEHEFRKRSRPLLAVSHDGRSLSIVGGRFEFTDAGIEDR
jgi:hypothetical protein